MLSILALVSLAVVSSVNAGPLGRVDAPAYLLCANRRLSPDGVIYYMHPLLASTSHPAVEPPVVDFNYNVSTVVFSTGPTTVGAFVNENGRNNVMLVNTRGEPTSDYYSIDLDNFRVKSAGSDDWITSQWASVAYVSPRDEYWKYNLDFVPSGDSATIRASLNNDLGDKWSWSFVRQWDTERPAFVSAGALTANSADQLLFMTVDYDNWPAGPRYSLLMTYDIQAKGLAYNVTCKEQLALRFSETRKTLFGAILKYNDKGRLIPSSVVEVDPSNCHTRVLIDNLPAFDGIELWNGFNDVSGDWYFGFRADWDSKKFKSSFYVLNIDTRKVTDVVEFKYNQADMEVSGIATYQNSAATTYASA